MASHDPAQDAGEDPSSAELIAARFKTAVKRYGLDQPFPPLAPDQFRVPPEFRPQLDLFDLPSPISGEGGRRSLTDGALAALRMAAMTS